MNSSTVSPIETKIFNDPPFIKKTRKSFRHTLSDAAHSVIPEEPGKRFILFSIILVTIIFLVVFMVWMKTSPESFNSFSSEQERLDYKNSKKPLVDGFYYWTTVSSTVGFGDICPKTIPAKITTGFYQLFIGALSAGLLWLITDKHISSFAKTMNLKRFSVTQDSE